MTDLPAKTATPRPAPRKKRWLLRIAIALAALVVLAVIIVQLVLWSNLPRGIAVSQIEKQLGLRLQVQSLSTGWLGNTRLTNVTVSLPLSTKAFLEVPVMKVKNTSLFGLMLGRPVAVKAIVLNNPHIYVVQDAGGQWNLQEVAQLLARAGGQKPSEESAATSSVPALPNVQLVGGIITIIDNKNRKAEIEPLSVNGYRDTAVSWKYDVRIPPRVKITGRLVPGGNWAHELAIELADPGYWAKPWFADLPALNVDATWRGALTSAGPAGRLDLRKVTLGLKTGAVEAYGAVSAAMTGAGVILKPENLLIKTGQTLLPDLSIASGVIDYTLSSRDVQVQQLLVNLFGGPARVTADFNLNSHAGRLDAGWERLALPGNITHSGSFNAIFRQPFPNEVVLDAHLTSRGNTPSGPWTAAATFGLDGQSLTRFTWTASASQLNWQRTGGGVDLDGLSLTGALQDNVISIGAMRLPNPDLLSGSASYEFTADQNWQANIEGQHWPFQFISGTQIAFALSARGGKERQSAGPLKNAIVQVTHLENFVLKTPDARLSANGTYTSGLPKPLDVNLLIVNAPPTQAPAAVASSPKAKLINGAIEGRASLQGTIAPLKLEVRGHLDGREIDIRGHHLGQFSALLSDQSHIDGNGAFIYTQHVKLLGGEWGIDGAYVFGSDQLKLDVGLDGVSLADVATVAGQQDISGTMGGQFSIIVPGLNPDPATISLSPAPITVRNLRVRGLAIDEVTATIALDRGALRIEPIVFKRGAGRGQMRLATAVADFRRIDLGAHFENWPVEIPGAIGSILAGADIPDAVVELPIPASADPAKQKLRITAHRIDLNSATTLKGELLGNVIVHAGLNGREIDVRGVHMKLLGGRFDGQAHATLDDPLASTFEFTWENLDFKKFAAIFPQLKDLSGSMTGDARLAPATVPHPREPLAIVITTKFANGAWRTIPLQDARIAAYIGPNPEAPETGWRIVLEDNRVDPSFIHVDEGTIELWARFGFHGRGSSSQWQVSIRDANLNRVVHAFDPSAHQMPGRVSGTMMLIRSPAPSQPTPTLASYRMFPAPPPQYVAPIQQPTGPHSPLERLIYPIYAEGRIDITNANLANFGPFTFLYDTAKLFQKANVAEGNGNIDFHLERGKLSIEHLRYFNRGTEILAVAAVDKIWELPNSPLSGSGIITARPLRDVKLPFFSDFETVLTSVQSSLSLTAARVVGTVHQPRPIGPLGITDMSSDLLHFLVGDAKGENQTGAGG